MNIVDTQGTQKDRDTKTSATTKTVSTKRWGLDKVQVFGFRVEYIKERNLRRGLRGRNLKSIIKQTLC